MFSVEVKKLNHKILSDIIYWCKSKKYDIDKVDDIQIHWPEFEHPARSISNLQILFRGTVDVDYGHIVSFDIKNWEHALEFKLIFT